MKITLYTSILLLLVISCDNSINNSGEEIDSFDYSIKELPTMDYLKIEYCERLHKNGIDTLLLHYLYCVESEMTSSNIYFRLKGETYQLKAKDKIKIPGSQIFEFITTHLEELRTEEMKTYAQNKSNGEYCQLFNPHTYYETFYIMIDTVRIEKTFDVMGLQKQVLGQQQNDNYAFNIQAPLFELRELLLEADSIEQAN